MCEAPGDEKLPLVLVGELHGHVPAERRRAWPQVHGHVEHTPLDHAHELGLCVFAALEVHAAHYGALGVALVVLHEMDVGDFAPELAFLEALEEIPAGVVEHSRFYYLYTLDGGFGYLHSSGWPLVVF